MYFRDWFGSPSKWFFPPRSSFRSSFVRSLVYLLIVLERNTNSITCRRWSSDHPLRSYSRNITYLLYSTVQKWFSVRNSEATRISNSRIFSRLNSSKIFQTLTHGSICLLPFHPPPLFKYPSRRSWILMPDANKRSFDSSENDSRIYPGFYFETSKHRREKGSTGWNG